MKPLASYKGDNLQIISKKDVEDGMLTWADQVIVATNATRTRLNKQIRSMLGKHGDLMEGDKLICLRNYWDDLSDQGDALVNGTIVYAHNPEEQIIKIPPYIKTSVREIEGIGANITTDTGDIYQDIIMDKKMILTGEQSLDWRDSYTLGKAKWRVGDLVPKYFTYGYAITCHKSQGSEWNDVLVFEENFPYDKEEHYRWLYTACTRSASRLILVRAN